MYDNFQNLTSRIHRYDGKYMWDPSSLYTQKSRVFFQPVGPSGCFVVSIDFDICWDRFNSKQQAGMGGIQGSIQKGCDEAPLHTESSGWGQIFLETWTEGCCSVNMKMGENHGLLGGLEHEFDVPIYWE